MWGATTPKLKNKCIKFLQTHAKAAALNIMERGLKFNNIMNIINIIKMLLKSIDLAATGKIITCTGKKVDPIRHAPSGGGGGAPRQQPP